MSTMLVKNIQYLATFDDNRREIKDGALLVRDNVIEAVGTTAELGSPIVDRVLDLTGHVVMPGAQRRMLLSVSHERPMARAITNNISPLSCASAWSMNGAGRSPISDSAALTS